MSRRVSPEARTGLSTRSAFLALALAAPGSAQGAPDPVSFHADVRPILQASCQGCHQPAKAGAKLVLTGFAELARGGKSGAAVVPGDPDASLLVEEISPFGDLPPNMPKDRAPLDAEALALIRRWIAEGAVDDTPQALGPAVSREHPPAYTRPPVASALAFSPDGGLLAVSGANEVVLCRAQSGELAERLVGLSERIESLAFSPDGSRLAAAGGTPARMGELQIWDVGARELALSLPVTHDTIFGASWSDDGSRVAFGCTDHTVRAVDAKTGAEILYQGAHDDWVLDTAFSTDASHLVTVSRDRSMKLIKVETQQFIDNITSITPGALGGGLIAVARHPARDELLVGGADGAPKVFRMYREKKRVIGDDYNLVRAYAALPGRIFGVAWSPDGERLAVCSSDHGKGTVRVYAAGAEEPLWSLETAGALYALAFHPSGDVLAAGGAEGVVRYHDADTGWVVNELVPAPLGLGREETGS